MRRLCSVVGAGGLVLGLGVAAAPTASADVINAVSCEEVDYQVSNGTTVVFSYGPDCPYGGYYIYSGDPDVRVGTGDGQPLIWYQGVGRTAGAACADGWTASWAQWPNDGAGGFTCERALDWGTGPGEGTRLYVTVRVTGDLVVVDPDDWDQWVAGCQITPPGDTPYGDNFYPDLRGNCS